MISNFWPTKILHNNIKDNVAVEQAFNYILSTFPHNKMPSNKSGINLASKEYVCSETKPIIDFIEEQIKTYLENIWQFTGTFSFKVHATDHNQITVHNHSGSHLSGVFYLSVPQGDLLFYDPRYNANRGYPVSVRDKEFGHKTLELVEGDCVIFPSFLWHESTPNKSNLPRIIMPFDVWMRDE